MAEGEACVAITRYEPYFSSDFAREAVNPTYTSAKYARSSVSWLYNSVSFIYSNKAKIISHGEDNVVCEICVSKISSNYEHWFTNETATTR